MARPAACSTWSPMASASWASWLAELPPCLRMTPRSCGRDGQGAGEDRRASMAWALDQPRALKPDQAGTGRR